MVSETNKAIDEALIRTLLEARVLAIRTRYVNGVMCSSTPNVVCFGIANALQAIGLAAARKQQEEWFALFDGRIGHEIWDLSITTGEDVAFSHSLNRVIATTPDGKKIDRYWRTTVCYRKIQGQWLITHEHSSVPFDPVSGKAALELKP